VPAPEWARALADEAIRERDGVPSVIFPPTPREDDGSRDDLVDWLRTVEWFCDVVANGWVPQRDWSF
jgi:hypothetical protein